MNQDARVQTFRHIEAVRNFLNTCIKELLHRAEQHDQTKLQSPEKEGYQELTYKLRGLSYGTPEYTENLKALQPTIDHHYAHNRHHPEFHASGIQDMNLIDVLEMFCDWKASSMRHNDGNILKSIQVNQMRFQFSDELRHILENTAQWLETQQTFHHTEES